MPGPMPAELAERLSDANIPEVTADEERAAVQSIIDDYMLMGETYPKGGWGWFGRHVINVGSFLRQRLEEDDIEQALAQILTHEADGDLQLRLQRMVNEEAPAWILKHYPDLVQLRADELREDDEWA